LIFPGHNGSKFQDNSRTFGTAEKRSFKDKSNSKITVSNRLNIYNPYISDYNNRVATPFSILKSMTSPCFSPDFQG
jgi:hypothetical protein